MTVHLYRNCGILFCFEQNNRKLLVLQANVLIFIECLLSIVIGKVKTPKSFK